MLDGGLTGKVAVVTGAAGGIGGAVATAFADAGAEVVGLDREQADLSVADEVESFFAGLERVDILFNGAGISGRRFGDGPVDECTEVAWDTVLATNLKSVFLCSKHAVPLLRAAGGGAIVNLASIHGLVGGDADFATHAYAASKAGIVGLTRAMAVHYARGRDPLQRNRTGPDQDTDEPARAERPGHPGAPARAAAAHRRLRPARRTSPALLSTSRPRRSSRAPCSWSTGAGPPSEPPPRARPRRNVRQVGRPGGRCGRSARPEEDARGRRPGGRDRAADRGGARGRRGRLGRDRRAWSLRRRHRRR